jgi:hypothetical protein
MIRDCGSVVFATTLGSFFARDADWSAAAAACSAGVSDGLCKGSVLRKDHHDRCDY